MSRFFEFEADCGSEDSEITTEGSYTTEEEEEEVQVTERGEQDATVAVITYSKFTDTSHLTVDERTEAIRNDEERMHQYMKQLHTGTLTESPIFDMDEYLVCSITKEGTTYKLNGKLHRATGPARILRDGTREWFWMGLLHSYNDKPAIISGDGRTKKWYFCGLLHRSVGPSITSDEVTKYFFMGLLHRVGGPAVLSDSYEYYYFYGCPHRLDGPAIIEDPTKRYRCYSVKWFIFGKLDRIDGPAIEDSFGEKRYYICGVLTCATGCAVVTRDGTRKWYKDGVLHRLGGSAVIFANGKEQIWENGELIGTIAPPVKRCRLIKIRDLHDK